MSGKGFCDKGKSRDGTLYIREKLHDKRYMYYKGSISRQVAEVGINKV